MRTPLSIIQTGLDVLEDEIGSKQPRSTLQSTVTDLRQPCQDCLVILNDLLSYEKLDAGIMHIECNEQDPSVFLTSTVRLFIVSARKKEIDLTVQSDVTIGSCTVDVDEKKVSTEVVFCSYILLLFEHRWVRFSKISCRTLSNLLQ